MITVIMQPTYLPWIGYFDLMDLADCFVLLDNVQFEKQSWQQRNRIKSTDGKWKWLSVPVSRNLLQHIHAVRTNNSQPWRRKHWGTIEQYYKKSKFWHKYSSELQDIYSHEWEFLVDLNEALIVWLMKSMGIKTNLMRASTLPVKGQKVSLLIDICHHVGADVYLSPVGSAVYIEEDNRFGQAGIELRYQQFDPPVYSQLYGKFIAYMSAIDLLFNEGDRSLEIIRSSGCQARISGITSGL